MKTPRTEPTAIVISMALTALASSYVNLTTTPVWQKVLDYLVMIFAGTSATQLYWSLIIPQLRDQLDASLTTEFLRKLVNFYLRVSTRFLIGQWTAKEMRLLGYINGLLAFLIFFFVELFHIAMWFL